jgi:hypothetical protein
LLARPGKRSYLAALTLVAAACSRAPHSLAIAGTFVPASAEELAAAARRTVPARAELVRFAWRSDDGRVQLSGSGAARIAPPDSMRVDIAAALGLGRATLILTGDSAVARPADVVRQVLPDRFALWAALGVLRVPAGDLTVARFEDGERSVWRVTDGEGRVTLFELRGDTLVGGSREVGGRTAMQLTLERGPDGGVRLARLLDLVRPSRLEIAIQGREERDGFPDETWRLRP